MSNNSPTDSEKTACPHIFSGEIYITKTPETINPGYTRISNSLTYPVPNEQGFYKNAYSMIQCQRHGSNYIQI